VQIDRCASGPRLRRGWKIESIKKTAILRHCSLRTAANAIPDRVLARRVVTMLGLSLITNQLAEPFHILWVWLSLIIDGREHTKSHFQSV
jgi:hypothetical protein